MAIRYTSKVFNILMKIKEIVDNSEMPDDDKEQVSALLNAAETITQAGHLVACGRTLKAFEVSVGMTQEQMEQTYQFKSLAELDIGDSVVVKCPREWFNYIRAILKCKIPTLRMRSQCTKEGELIVTRTK